jgi:hypothetical protein
MWIYSAILRSAAEFRGSVTFGTDFDANDDVYRQARQMGIIGKVGIWMALAASTLGKTLYTQPNVPLGATLANYDARIPLRVVGVIDARYRVVSRQGEGPDMRVELGMWGDERRVPLHSKLLFAIGVLPDSKVGGLTLKATIKVEESDRRSRRARIRGKDVDGYLTMCRAFGWDVTLETGPGIKTVSWADNYSRLAWGAKNFDEFPHAVVYVLDAKERPDPKNKIWFTPYLPNEYHYEVRIAEVGTLYDYQTPDATGSFIPKVRVRKEADGTLKVEKQHMVMDLELKDFTIRASRADFNQVEDWGSVPVPTPAPPMLVDEIPPPGNDEEYVDEDLTVGEVQ